jgi:hypothetical protein
MAGNVPTVVIVLPGLGGSELRNKDESIWPGDFWDVFGYPERKLKILINDPLIPSDIVRTVIGIPIYQSLIDFLGDRGY